MREQLRVRRAREDAAIGKAAAPARRCRAHQYGDQSKSGSKMTIDWQGRGTVGKEATRLRLGS